MDIKKILIGGEWVSTSESMTISSPFSGEKIADVYSANGEEFSHAVACAKVAAAEMRKLARFEISEGLRRISQGIYARRSEFERTIAEESAKPIRTARSEVERGIATFAWAAGEAERFAGDVVPVDIQPNGRGKTAYTMRIPRGIIYGITPFNFPLNLVAHKVAPALASGNSIIIKPSQRTPLTSLLLGEVFLESGLPKSALQIVPMDLKYMDVVYSDERIRMISFTGSDAVGWDLKQKAGKKVVALELGGNAPVIVDESADLNDSVEKTVSGTFSYAGQVCISVQRIYIHKNLFDKWTKAFIAKAEALNYGDPLDELTDLSSMIDEKAAQKLEGWVNEAVENGAELMCSGVREGARLDPVIITNTNPEMRIVSEEAFGPVAIVEKFADFHEAVNEANHSKFGLQAGVFTQSLANAAYAAENLEYGGVILNDVPTFRVDNMPYGGMKNSGFGREGVRYAMEEMSELRLIVSNI